MPEKRIDSKGIYLGWKSLLTIGGVFIALLIYIHESEMATVKANTISVTENTLAINKFSASVNQLKRDLSHVDALMIEKWNALGDRLTKVEGKIE